jgi:hypothetical protein
MGSLLKDWLIIALLCVILVPILVFLGGWVVAGPYEGNGGIFGLMGTIYKDALLADLAAWVLLLSPLLLFAIWRCCFWLRRLA